MCRISGISSLSFPTEALRSMVGEMCQILKHGGPDDEGIFVEEGKVVLGHRRLSLIDLSKAGHQPMSYAHGRFQITYNGEIYNYKELKAELQEKGALFTTHSDTEVILAAFEMWGIQSFDRFNGMFAFVLWDHKEGKLYLVRDAAGIKPLYYAITKEGLAFASEVRAFKPIPWLREENPVWQVYMMAYGHLPEPVTVLKEVKPLEKGTFLCYEIVSGKYRVEIFKKFSFIEYIGNRQEALHLLKDTLHDSVLRHLVADAPIGAFLSGGIDSSIISLLANSHSQTQLNTLSLIFEDDAFSEKKYQDIVLEKLNCHSSQHLLKAAEFHACLPQIIADMDQPSCDGINTWFISRFAKEKCLKAVLSGIGSDELMGGYPSFRRMQKVNMLESLPNRLLRTGKYTGLKKLRRLGYLAIPGAIGKYLFLRGQFIPFEIAEHLGLCEEEVWDILRTQPRSENLQRLSAPNQASWIETNLFMQNQLLRDGDVMSMAHGIEIRVPFMDKQFIELAHSLRSGIKFSGSLPKQLLIDAFKDILPEPIWNRPKMGFGLPFKKWLAEDEYIRSVISPDSPAFEKFTSGSMHWSQFLSLFLIKNNQVLTSGKNWAAAGNGPLHSAKKAIPPAKEAASKGTGMEVLFLTLRTFSGTGGIEKVSKVAGKALYELCREQGGKLSVWSMYDAQEDIDEKYFPATIFKGFGINKVKFTASCVAKGRNSDVVILSHINLLAVGYLMKLAAPDIRLILFAHGIEVWEPFNSRQHHMLQKCNDILSVSSYTRDKLCTVNGINESRIRVLNNCLDPFLQEPLQKEKDAGLLQKYGFKPDDTIMMTLTRLAAREQYKGYDKVLESLTGLRKDHPGLKYLVIGKYDEAEKSRLNTMLSQLHLEDKVVFAGFVPDEQLAEHFNLADIYIMPSTKEGFGIVFIEAMYYHKPVIAGNQDGSVDALLNGRLGLLVNPGCQVEITTAIEEMIRNRDQYLPENKVLMDNFGFPVYKEKWRALLHLAIRN